MTTSTPQSKLAVAADEIAREYLGDTRYHKYLVNVIITHPILIEMVGELVEMKCSATCTYCGDTVDRTADSIAVHSMSCEKHPIHSLKLVVKECDQLKQQLTEARDFINTEDTEKQQALMKCEELKQQLEAANTKLNHFTDSATKPHSIDDATMREWDLANKNQKLTQRIAELEKCLSNIAACGQSIEPDHWKFRCMARESSQKALNPTTKL